ncbi:MAG: hypothetical protein H0X51_02235 [Parachlamydiaceae bacterium]|nr:hypothetical protein [Parachlamydiaceae bacterium]
MRFFVFLFLISLCLASCNTPTPLSNQNTQYIYGRDSGNGERIAIYRAQVPTSWLRQDFSHQESVIDTTKPLCTWTIPQDVGSIRITVHNFPSDQIEKRVTQAAQVTRWQRQFATIDASSVALHAESRGGFAGLFLEASGVAEGQKMTLLAWAMNLSPDHYATLSTQRQIARLETQKQLFRQMQADYTIKVLGPSDIVEKYKSEIIAFAASFELIEEIPSSF